MSRPDRVEIMAFGLSAVNAMTAIVRKERCFTLRKNQSLPASTTELTTKRQDGSKGTNRAAESPRNGASGAVSDRRRKGIRRRCCQSGNRRYTIHSHQRNQPGYSGAWSGCRIHPVHRWEAILPDSAARWGDQKDVIG